MPSSASVSILAGDIRDATVVEKQIRIGKFCHSLTERVTGK